MIFLKSVFVFLIVILIFHIIATFNYWYWTYLWLDMPMHFLGGFWAAMAAIALISNYQFPISKESIGQKFLPFLIVILSFVALVGVLWEFYEFLNDIFLSSKNYTQIFQQGAADTMGDLFFDLLGGAAFMLIFKFFSRKA
jgi:hypothetical protein